MLRFDILTPMATRERFIIWGWIAVVVAAGIFPPWVERGSPEGYHLLFSPPRYRGAIHVDQSRLMIEWIIVTVTAAGLRFAPLNFKRKPEPEIEVEPYQARLPMATFRKITGLPPDGETGEITFKCEPKEDPDAPKVPWEIQRRTHIGVSRDPEFLFTVPLEDGGIAWFSSLDGAEHFRRNHSGLVKWTKRS